MWWGIGAALIVAIVVFVRWGGSDIRYIGQAVGKAINIKPHIIEEMVMKMGQERSTMLAKQLRSFPKDVMQDAVTTVFVYQVVKNNHPENVKWWKKQVMDGGFSSELTLENVETAFMYLRNAGEAFDVSQPWKFLEAYKQQFGNT